MFNLEDALWSSHPSANQAKLIRAMANVKAANVPGGITEELVKAEYVKLGGRIVEKGGIEEGMLLQREPKTEVKIKKVRSLKKIVKAIIGKD